MAEPFIPSDKGSTKPAPNQLAQRSPQVTQLSPKPGQKVATLTPSQEGSPILDFHIHILFSKDMWVTGKRRRGFCRPRSV